MMKKIEQLQEVQKNCESMGPIRPSAARKPAAAAASPASRPQLNFVSPQTETLQKILESNGTHGPPSKQPVHNSRLRAGLQSLCKHNYDRKDYENQNKPKMKQN
jgi:hypothetical protein